MEENNKMKNEPVNKLMLQMGVPMILSMALQAVYKFGDLLPDSGSVFEVEGDNPGGLSLAADVDDNTVRDHERRTPRPEVPGLRAEVGVRLAGPVLLSGL